MYRERNRVARLINRLKQSRRLATRYGKRACHSLAMLMLAAVLLWVRERPHASRSRNSS